MRVALIGGAFDPPHNGHILCVSNLFNSKLVDQVWLVPSGDGRYDKKSEASSALRKKMLEIIVENDFKRDSRIKIELSQIDNPKDPCYTSELLKRLARQHSSNEF